MLYFDHFTVLLSGSFSLYCDCFLAGAEAVTTQNSLYFRVAARFPRAGQLSGGRAGHPGSVGQLVLRNARLKGTRLTRLKFHSDHRFLTPFYRALIQSKVADDP